MSHSIHEPGTALVLYDECEECHQRARLLWEIDTEGLQKLGDLAADIKHPPSDASGLDLMAAHHLRLFGRVVLKSGIERSACI